MVTGSQLKSNFAVCRKGGQGQKEEMEARLTATVTVTANVATRPSTAKTRPMQLSHHMDT